ncbi:MAG: hypothetical protein LBQ02_04840 [Candidatus Nomurabacteria bacterium]|jgi:hypothetical protein|nr:hypothetical protein [Candidatus Nomurabacteria bacterium]
MSEVPDKQIKRLKSLLQEAETNVAAAKELLGSLLGDGEKAVSRTATKKSVATGAKIIEGVFDGQIMLGPEGKSYPVPANYASKSKLVEGDLLKLTIDADGSFIYKQIDKTPRKQLIGTLVNHDGAYFVEASGKEYKILLASVTYFKIKEGDQVAIIVPERKEEATWAAVETAL